MAVNHSAQLRDNRSARLRDEVRKILKVPSMDFFYAEDLIVRENLQTKIEEKLRGGSLAYSVSHSKSFGGAAFVDSAFGPIGFDIEETSRVTEAVALRVSDEHQLRIAPTAAAIFVAKEAAFKALRGPRQPKILSEVEIINWEVHPFSPPIYSFKAGLKGHSFQWFGVCFEDNQHTVGISFFPHST